MSAGTQWKPTLALSSYPPSAGPIEMRSGQVFPSQNKPQIPHGSISNKGEHQGWLTVK